MLWPVLDQGGPQQRSSDWVRKRGEHLNTKYEDPGIQSIPTLQATGWDHRDHLVKHRIVFCSFSLVSGYSTAASLCTLQLCGTTSTLCWITESTSPPPTPPSICSTTCRAAPWCWSSGASKVRMEKQVDTNNNLYEGYCTL